MNQARHARRVPPLHRPKVVLGVGTVVVGLALSAFWASRAQPVDHVASKVVAQAILPSATADQPPTTAATGPAQASRYTGPGLTTPGVRLSASPNASGDLEVVERVIFASTSDWVLVTPPDIAGVAGLTGTKPRLEDLQASADGSLVAVQSPGVVTAQVRLDLPPNARGVELRYRLTGASRRSQPAPPGRALAVLAPVTSEGLGNLPVVVEVSGSSILNLVCPRLSFSQQLCGRQQQGMWVTLPMPAAKATVIAQLDLPEPG